jgi:hypothetical protein
MGALILIDAVSNATVGAAMIVAAVESAADGSTHAGFFLVRGGIEAAEALRAKLLQRGERAVIVDDALIPENALAGAVRALQLAGVAAISAREDLSGQTLEDLRKVAGEAFFEVEDAR